MSQKHCSSEKVNTEFRASVPSVAKNNNMKKLIIKTFVFLSALAPLRSFAQENMHPAPPQTGSTTLVNAVIHMGNGQVINGDIVFENGKIVYIGAPENLPADYTKSIIDLRGKQVYPGFIATSTNLGLVEVSAVRSTFDFTELGDINPSIRS